MKFCSSSRSATNLSILLQCILHKLHCIALFCVVCKALCFNEVILHCFLLYSHCIAMYVLHYVAFQLLLFVLMYLHCIALFCIVLDCVSMQLYCIVLNGNCE